MYYGKTPIQLVGYSDADYAGDVETRRSTSGRVFLFMNGPISWAAKQQRSVSTSTAQAEYVALSAATAECLWLRKICATLLRVDRLPTTNMMEDNTAALKWCYNPMHHSKQKHIPVAYHFVREQVAQFDNINVVAVKTDLQLADLFTKCLPVPRMRFLVDSIRGLNPALPATSKMQGLKEMMRKGSEKMQEVLPDFDLKKQLLAEQSEKSLAHVSADTFNEEHFKEKDPRFVPEMHEHMQSSENNAGSGSLD